MVKSLKKYTILGAILASSQLFNTADWGLRAATISTPPQFAYIPQTIQIGELHIINTQTRSKVTSVDIGEYPAGVAINQDGSLVYVILRKDLGTIEVVDTETNTVIASITDAGQYPNTITINKSKNTLYVAYAGGVREFVLNDAGLMSNETKEIPVDYFGNDLEIFNDLVISIGYSVGTQPGISVYNTATATTQNLLINNGITNDPSAIAVDILNNKIYVANRSDHSVLVYAVNGGLITYEKEIVLDVGMSPIDLRIDTKKKRLYISNSGYTKAQGEDLSTIINVSENGNIQWIDLNTPDPLKTIPVYHEQDGQIYGHPIHPWAIDVDANGQVILVKDIWGQTSGFFISNFKPYGFGDSFYPELSTPLFAGGPNEKGGQAQITGEFLGPPCSKCPTGLGSSGPKVLTRPAALSLSILGLLGLLLAWRKFKN